MKHEIMIWVNGRLVESIEAYDLKKAYKEAHKDARRWAYARKRQFVHLDCYNASGKLVMTGIYHYSGWNVDFYLERA